MLSRLAERLTCLVTQQTGGGDRERAILRYGSEMAMLTFGELMLIVLAAWAWDCIPTTLAACLAMAALRSVAGGIHCTSAGRCTVVTVLVFVALGKVGSLWTAAPGTTAVVALGAGFLSGLAVVFRAPLENPAKPLGSPAHKRLLRRLSLFMVFLITVTGLTVALRPGSGNLAFALALGESWAALMITGAGKAVIGLADRTLQYRPWPFRTASPDPPAGVERR
ncbi:MAG: accessory gene regulator B family protein [Thermoanaerobacterales bacterium]|nr:accessory gene regulator B family protein [Bacillota bacterium]MDI6907594.1 accessory gene regulator B family protein [Thermoanaerobacterales bacterium]